MNEYAMINEAKRPDRTPLRRDITARYAVDNYSTPAIDMSDAPGGELQATLRRAPGEIGICIGQRAAYLAGGIRPPRFWPGNGPPNVAASTRQLSASTATQETLF